MIVGVSTAPREGRRIIAVDGAGTVLFTVVTVVEVIVLSWTRPVAVIVDLGLFAIGCATFLGAYAIAIGRSRSEEIGVASLFLLTNDVAPKPVRRGLWAILAVQCVVAVTAASVRPFTTAAFSVLVPMFGLGLNGLWAARHGSFGPRVMPVKAVAPTDDAAEDAPDTDVDTEMEQNAPHG